MVIQKYQNLQSLKMHSSVKTTPPTPTDEPENQRLIEDRVEQTEGGHWFPTTTFLKKNTLAEESATVCKKTLPPCFPVYKWLLLHTNCCCKRTADGFLQACCLTTLLACPHHQSTEMDQNFPPHFGSFCQIDTFVGLSGWIFIRGLL